MKQRPITIQTKLKVNSPGDKYEVEAILSRVHKDELKAKLIAMNFADPLVLNILEDWDHTDSFTLKKKLTSGDSIEVRGLNSNHIELVSLNTVRASTVEQVMRNYGKEGHKIYYTNNGNGSVKIHVY